jgi:hypothetical protein
MRAYGRNGVLGQSVREHGFRQVFRELAGDDLWLQALQSGKPTTISGLNDPERSSPR